MFCYYSSKVQSFLQNLQYYLSTMKEDWTLGFCIKNVVDFADFGFTTFFVNDHSLRIYLFDKQFVYSLL